VHLVFDIIATRKHITPSHTTGPPYRLGLEIYEYVARTYGALVSTTFVGLTDNPARRVGRDVYYGRTTALSPTHLPFSVVDSAHLFVVYPPSGGAGGRGGVTLPPL
jgi:hypothetical protein